MTVRPKNRHKRDRRYPLLITRHPNGRTHTICIGKHKPERQTP